MKGAVKSDACEAATSARRWGRFVRAWHQVLLRRARSRGRIASALRALRGNARAVTIADPRRSRRGCGGASV